MERKDASFIDNEKLCDLSCAWIVISIMITINISNKVLLSALFLLPRLSLTNIYKYRTVPRWRRNSKGRTEKEGKKEGREGGRKRKERPEESERGRMRGKARMTKMLETKQGRGEELDNQDSTTVCKRPSPGLSKQEEAECAPCGLGAGGAGGGA